MAKQMSYADERGTTHSISYWRVALLTISAADQIASLVFYGYKDQTAYQAGKAPVGVHAYQIDAVKFIAFMTRHLAPGGPNIMQLAYEHATNTKDTGPVPALGQPDTRVSFFDSATDV